MTKKQRAERMRKRKEMRKKLKAITVLVIDTAGGPARIAREFNKSGIKISRQGVYDWARVPEKYLEKMSQLSGMTAQEMRPDVPHAQRTGEL
jgi:hypothetical protein